VFDELFILDVRGSGNMILLALPRRQALNRDDFSLMARTVSNSRKMRFDLGDPVNYGFFHAASKDQGMRVLRDPQVSR